MSHWQSFISIIQSIRDISWGKSTLPQQILAEDPPEYFKGGVLFHFDGFIFFIEGNKINALFRTLQFFAVGIAIETENADFSI